MDHLNDIDILEYVNGTLESRRQPAVRSHLAACPTCRQRHREFTETWRRLGSWSAEAGNRDLTVQILNRVMQSTSQNDASLHRLKRWGLAGLRTAAAIGLAVGIGVAAGRWSKSHEPRQSVFATANHPSETAVGNSLFAGCLKPKSATGLTELVMEDDGG